MYLKLCNETLYLSKEPAITLTVKDACRSFMSQHTEVVFKRRAHSGPQHNMTRREILAFAMECTPNSHALPLAVQTEPKQVASFKHPQFAQTKPTLKRQSSSRRYLTTSSNLLRTACVSFTRSFLLCRASISPSVSTASNFSKICASIISPSFLCS